MSPYRLRACELLGLDPAQRYAGYNQERIDRTVLALARARQEGAEEMREHIAREVSTLISQGVTQAFLVDAIRALDAGDPAARRG